MKGGLWGSIMKFLRFLVGFFVVCVLYASDKIINDEGSVSLKDGASQGEYKLNVEGDKFDCNLFLKIRNGRVVNVTTTSNGSCGVVTCNYYVITCENCGEVISTGSDGSGDGSVRSRAVGLCEKCASQYRDRFSKG